MSEDQTVPAETPPVSDEIQIGDRTYHIARFRGLKATIAGALMARVMRKIPTLQESVADFRKTYRERNTLVITPFMANLPRFAPLGLTREDFEAGGGKVEIPEEPAPQAVFIHVFPDLWEFARPELQKFLALIVIPNSELEEADDADDIEGALATKGKNLLREGDVDELMELIVVGLEVFREQMAKNERLGNSQIPFINNLLGRSPQTESGEEMEEMMIEEEQENDGPGMISETPTESPLPKESSPPPSSSPLPEDLVGVEEKSSTESPGTS